MFIVNNIERHGDPYENLAIAIISKAYEDLEKAIIQYRKGSKYSDKNKRIHVKIKALGKIKEVSSFFNSEWFVILSPTGGNETFCIFKELMELTPEEKLIFGLQKE